MVNFIKYNVSSLYTSGRKFIDVILLFYIILKRKFNVLFLGILSPKKKSMKGLAIATSHNSIKLFFDKYFIHRVFPKQ